MKKLLIYIFFVWVILSIPVGRNAKVEAKNNTEFETSVENLVDDFDYGELENYFEEENLEVFKNNSLGDTIKEIITSGNGISFVDIINIIFSSIGGELESVIKLIALIVAIVGFGSFSNMLSSSNKNGNSMASIINFFLLVIILSIITTIIVDFVDDTINLLEKIKNLMEVIFPLLLSLLVTVGGSASSATFQPAVVILTGGIIEVIVFLTSTIITLLLCLSVIGELTDSIKFDKLKSFLSSLYKWVLGLIFTVFLGYLSLTGITAGGTDRISIKTAKYAIKSYIPLVGGYVSDSYEIFRMGSVLIKNSLGMIGVVLLFSLVIGRVVSLILYNLGFKLAGGLTEPMMGAGRITRFLSSISTIFNFLIASIVACFLLCFFMILLIMSSANIV